MWAPDLMCNKRAQVAKAHCWSWGLSSGSGLTQRASGLGSLMAGRLSHSAGHMAQSNFRRRQLDSNPVIWPRHITMVIDVL